MLPAAFVFCFGGKFVFGGRAFACTAGFFPRFGGSSVARPGGWDDASASSPTYYFTGYGRRQLLHHPLQQNTAAGAAEPEQPCHEQVLFPAGVDTPQHSQADTCAGAQPRKKTAKGNSPAHIQLG